MKFDVSPSGMQQTGNQATTQGGELEADVAQLLAAFDSAASATGDGAINTAVLRLAGDVQGQARMLGTRVNNTVNGAMAATGAIETGDQQMAANATQCQANSNFSIVRQAPGGGG